mmetsp:Transcript_447/g.545  ORF Transcript_447/g.545 Transcript_447/m.545 type:complete len:209 (-) Transcript_447:133-759(-)
MSDMLRKRGIHPGIPQQPERFLVDRHRQIVVHVQDAIGHATTGFAAVEFGRPALADVRADGIVARLVEASLALPGEFGLGRLVVVGCTASFGWSAIIHAFADNPPATIGIGNPSPQKGCGGGQSHHDGCHNGQLIVNKTRFPDILRLKRHLQTAASHPERHGIHVYRGSHPLVHLAGCSCSCSCRLRLFILARGSLFLTHDHLFSCNK